MSARMPRPDSRPWGDDDAPGLHAATASFDHASHDGIPGERTEPAVSRLISVQSRASTLLAAGLVIVVALTMLGWYYSNALGRQARARDAAQAASASRAQAEMPLPALGPIETPQPALPATDNPVPDDGWLLARLPDPPAEQTGGVFCPAGCASQDGAAATAVRPKTARELALERRLSGTVFVASPQVPPAASPPALRPSFEQAWPDPTDVMARHEGSAGVFGQGVYAGPGSAHPGARADAAIEQLLRPADTAVVAARMLPAGRFLLPKGTFIDCTLETAIDSTLPGMTTCITASDTFSADGQVVLLERGTKLVGETRGRVQQGAARVFVAWSEARTPTGVLVPLDSPGTDELGRSGLPGVVNRHFWDRFGAAILISVIDGAVQAGVQAASRGGNTVIYSPSPSRDVATEALKSTVDIPPTVVKAHGERIQVLVARDIDFRRVYALRAVPGF